MSLETKHPKKVEASTIQKIKKELEEIKASLMISNPFLSALIRNCNVRYIDVPNAYAGVDEKLNLYLGNSFNTLLPRQKTFVICHEALHIAFMHPKRTGGRKPRTWNDATDIVINEILFDILGDQRLPIWSIKRAEEVFGIDIDKTNLLAETIYDQIINSGKADSFDRPEFSDDFTIPIEDSEEIQEGNPEQYKDPEKFWKDAVSSAYAQQKMIGGTTPLGIDRLVKELLSPKINWALELASDIKTAFSNNAISSWRKIRRYDFSPTIEYLSSKKVYVLLDASGSISKDMLSHSLSEINKVISISHKVMLISFDTEAYATSMFTNSSAFLQYIASKGVKGGGGTMIQKSLELVLSKLKHGDALLIFTDGEIFDIGTSAVKNLLNNIANKTSYRAIVTFGVDLAIPRYKLIHYNGKGFTSNK